MSSSELGLTCILLYSAEALIHLICGGGPSVIMEPSSVGESHSNDGPSMAIGIAVEFQVSVY